MISLIKCMKCPSGVLVVGRDGLISLKCEFGENKFSPIPVVKMRNCPMITYERGKVPPRVPPEPIMVGS